MEGREDILTQRREIHFCGLNPHRDHAREASQLLGEQPGVIEVMPVSRLFLHVTYRLDETCLQALEELLVDNGFHLDSSLLFKLKRALYYYTERVKRDNLGCGRGSTNCTTRVFVSRYSRLPHGCRDSRPEHWRRYL